MNRKIGMVSSLVTLLAVAAFALCMLIGSNAGSYLASMFIAWGYLPMACAFAARAKDEARAAALTGVAFAAVYGVLIAVVYFAQLTAVRLSPLSEEALSPSWTTAGSGCSSAWTCWGMPSWRCPRSSSASP